MSESPSVKLMTSDWAADYRRDGYLVVPNLVDAGTRANLREGIERITADPDAVPQELRRHLHFERAFVRARPEYNELTERQVGSALRLIMELPLFAPMFAELICYEPLLDVLEALFGTTEFRFHNYKCILKEPRVSSRFLWHRDLPYLQHSTPNLITAMLCLDPMSEANGATVVLPGTHRIPHEQVKATDVDIREDELPEAERVTVECSAGSAVLFHVNLLHGGGANRSRMPRRNVISIWAGPDAFPTTSHRYAYHDLMPRSSNRARRRQVRMAFPHLFPNDDEPRAPAATHAAPPV